MDKGVVMGREGSVLETGGHGHGVIVLGPTLNALLHTSEEVHRQHCKDLHLVTVNLGPLPTTCSVPLQFGFQISPTINS